MTSEEILKNQLSAIAFVKSYLSRCKASNINIANSSFCYFAHWGYTLGTAKLKLKLEGISYLFSYLKIILLNFLGVSTLSNYTTIKHDINYKKYKNLVITNVSKKDFKSNGSCFDPWFQTNSRNVPNTLWFLNCIDNYIPKSFDKNIIIFARKKTLLRHDFSFFLINFFKTLLKFKFSIKKVLHEFSVHSQFSNIISEKILYEVSRGKFKNIINSYEAQPFQNSVFKKVKKFDEKIITHGFFHTALSPMSTSLIYRSGAPDKLLISGKYSKEYLSKYLSWPKKKIKVVPSFRYNNKNITNMSGFIYLPFNFFNLKKITNEFENYLKKCKPNSLNKLKIKNHTYANNSQKHKELIYKLESIIDTYKNRFTLKKKQKKSIIIGATSTVIVALQSSVEVIHICENPIFESYNEKLWKTLKVKQIGDNTFIYKQKIKNSLVKFTKNNNMLKKYFF